MYDDPEKYQLYLEKKKLLTNMVKSMRREINAMQTAFNTVDDIVENVAFPANYENDEARDQFLMDILDSLQPEVVSLRNKTRSAEDSFDRLTEALIMQRQMDAKLARERQTKYYELFPALE